MARSKYVYVLTWKDHVQSAAPILTATVKREFLDGLASAGSQIEDTEVWRMCDGQLLERTHLGSGDEYLARERPPVAAKAPCPEGFHWIGQPFTTCDQCALPAWDHEGMATYKKAHPFDDSGPKLKPWGPGEREGCWAKWDPQGYAAHVKAALGQLDGTTPSAVALLTGHTPEQLNELGGFDGR